MAKVGRPLIKLSDLRKDWEDKLLELASEGASIVELAVALGISRDTFYEISKREEKFSDTIKRCKQLAEAWWERQGRTKLETKEFNYVGWYMNMKNRFGWKDRHDVTSGDKEIKSVSVFKFNEDKPETKQGAPESDQSGTDVSDRPSRNE